MAVMLGIAPFLFVEVGLRVLGIGSDTDDLHAGFGSVAPLFEKNEGNGTYSTSLSKQQFFVSQEFPVAKADDEYRIFCLGGSTVQGRPYRPETSFSTWLQLELTAADSSKHYRSINCGGISYASYRLRPVLEEVLKYQPDMIVLATGHNEFLEDRTYEGMKSRSGIRMWVENIASMSRTVMTVRKLMGGAPRTEPTEDKPAVDSEDVEARLDDESGYASYHRDPSWHDAVRQQFRDSVEEMLTMCRTARVPVILVRLGSNLRDCPPFKSEHRSGLKVEDEQLWQRLFDQATAQQANDPAEALALYREALQLDAEHALLHFRIARCLDLLGRFDEAKQHYISARDQDICPLRMIGRVSETIMQIAETQNVPIIDADSAIASMSPDGIPGYDRYVDHVHPTIGAHQTIGQLLARNVLQIHGTDAAKRVTGIQRQQIYREHMRTLPDAYFGNGRRRIGWLEGWAQRQRLYEETIPVDVRGHMATATRYLELHDLTKAADHVHSAIAAQPEVTADLITRAAEYFSEGRVNESNWILQQVELSGDDHLVAHQLDCARYVIATKLGNDKAATDIRARHSNWDDVFSRGPRAWVDLASDNSR